MSREARWDAAFEALRAVDEASGGEAEAEVLLRVSRGVGLRRARGAPSEASGWCEESAAVRALLAGGGEGLATVASWEDVAEAARRAVAMAATAERDAAGPEASPAAGAGHDADAARLRVRRERVASRVATTPAAPQSPGDLAAALEAVEAEALGVDERIVALDVAFARSAVVDSYLVSTAGHAVHQRHATAQAHAATVARDGMAVSVRGDAWAGPRFGDAEARRFGRRLGRAGVLHLIGSGAAPPAPRVALLSARALAEMTMAFARVLVGLASPSASARDLLRDLPRELGLFEDAVDDEISRALPVDGAGRPLARVPVIANGAWTPPGPRALPQVRPGSGDAPQPGILRLTWSWDGPTAAAAEDDLVGRLGTGLWIETAQAISVDPATLGWRGAVAGFWVEDGRRRPVSGVPFAARLPDLLAGAIAGGATPESAHPSGQVRAVPLVVVLERPEAGGSAADAGPPPRER